LTVPRAAKIATEGLPSEVIEILFPGDRMASLVVARDVILRMTSPLAVPDPDRSPVPRG
jgi:hypothetical protein